MYLFSNATTPASDPLAAFRARVLAGDQTACLLTPTATMAEHIRHSLARQGAFVRPDSIVTLSRFVEPLVRDLQPAPSPRIEQEVALELSSDPPPIFGPLSQSGGLRRMLTSLIEEFSAAAGIHFEPDLSLPFSDTARAFFPLYQRVVAMLLLRPMRLSVAAQLLRSQQSPWRSLFLTGFFAFTPAELDVIAALGGSEVIISLPEWEGAAESRYSLRRMGFTETRLDPACAPVEATLFTASSQQQEAEEIARRILVEANRGRCFREMGVILRRQQPYAALLETTFRRYGIPVRFYFQNSLESHPVPRFLLTFLDALRSKWDHGITRPLLDMPLSGIAGTIVADQIDRMMRQRMPAAGLPPELEALGWRQFEPLLKALLSPGEWIAALSALKEILHSPPVPVPGLSSHREILTYREHCSALAAWDEALQQTADLLDAATPVPLSDFLSPLAIVLPYLSTANRDQRRNVVHVVDVYEARQWSLPVIFLCGMLERTFPQYHSEHPILTDADRLLLRKLPVILRTSIERQHEEWFLFQTACTAATSEIVFSYPRANSKGEETLPSFFLSRVHNLESTRTAAHPIRPTPRWPEPALAPMHIDNPSLRRALCDARSVLSPTAIETFLQCPFQFFGRHILKLTAAPPRPAERLDFLLQGDIIHRTLAESEGSPLFVEELFSRLFHQACLDHSVPSGCRTEKARLDLEANLRRFLESPALSGAITRNVERPFSLPLEAGLRIRGKIDRVVELPQRGLVVIDYKYSSRDRVRSRIRSHEAGDLVQGGLYLWAAEKLYKSLPAGMLYCGLRGEVSWMGWHVPVFGWEDIGEIREQSQLREMMDHALAASSSVAARIAQGEILPQPADKKKCVWCEFNDTCRIETAEPAPALVRLAGGAS